MKNVNQIELKLEKKIYQINLIWIKKFEELKLNLKKID